MITPAVDSRAVGSLRVLCADPAVGEPLHEDLAGLRKYRVRRYRIVYSIERDARLIHLVGVGHRRTIYDEIVERLRRGPRVTENRGAARVSRAASERWGA